jgi:hypothetical protein
LKTLSDVGAAKLAYDQSQLEAPLKRALNVAEIMRGYTYPTSSTETAETIPTVMSSSPLQQIAGLGSLLASGTQTESGWLNKILNSVGSNPSVGGLVENASNQTGLMGDFGT